METCNRVDQKKNPVLKQELFRDDMIKLLRGRCLTEKYQMRMCERMKEFDDGILVVAVVVSLKPPSSYQCCKAF